MSIKVKKETSVTSKLDVRVDPTDLASPRQNNETEEPEETGRALSFKKTRPQTSKLNDALKKSFLRQTSALNGMIDLKQGRSSLRSQYDINPDIDIDDLMTEEEKK